MYLVLLPAFQQACLWLDRTLESPPFQDVGWPCYQPDAGLTSMIWRNDVSLRLYISTKQTVRFDYYPEFLGVRCGSFFASRRKNLGVCFLLI
jgi:hypothetical protein